MVLWLAGVEMGKESGARRFSRRPLKLCQKLVVYDSKGDPDNPEKKPTCYILRNRKPGDILVDKSQTLQQIYMEIRDKSMTIDGYHRFPKERPTNNRFNIKYQTLWVPHFLIERIVTE